MRGDSGDRTGTAAHFRGMYRSTLTPSVLIMPALIVRDCGEQSRRDAACEGGENINVPRQKHEKIDLSYLIYLIKAR